MAAASTQCLPWRGAMQAALYGPSGFFRTHRPADHFRTSVHTSDQFAAAVGRIVTAVAGTIDTSMRRPVEVVDLGAGRGELLAALAPVLPRELRLVGVDMVPRPPELPPRVEWRRSLRWDVTGVIIANEWLDNVPLDVVEVDAAGRPRLVLVDPSTGAERLGRPVTGASARWLEQHWPVAGAQEGVRAEVGHPRDVAWARTVSRLGAGIAIAVDYRHDRHSRPPLGTLTGFRDGRQVRPVPDGSCDLTAHVALDACAAAVGPPHGPEVATALRTQRDVLRDLGVRGDLPPRELAGRDPVGYVRGLARASEAAALTAADGLGAFGWLAHARGVPLPPALAG